MQSASTTLIVQVSELQAVADKYAGTVEENRRLNNEVQDLKGNIRVFCRIRPLGTTGDHSEGDNETFLEYDNNIKDMQGLLTSYNWQELKTDLGCMLAVQASRLRKAASAGCAGASLKYSRLA